MYLVGALCGLVEAPQASVPAASGLSVVSVLLFGTRASPPLWAVTVDTVLVRGARASSVSAAEL